MSTLLLARPGSRGSGQPKSKGHLPYKTQSDGRLAVRSQSDDRLAVKSQADGRLTHRTQSMAALPTALSRWPPYPQHSVDGRLTDKAQRRVPFPQTSVGRVLS